MSVIFPHFSFGLAKFPLFFLYLPALAIVIKIVIKIYIILAVAPTLLIHILIKSKFK